MACGSDIALPGSDAEDSPGHGIYSHPTAPGCTAGQGKCGD